MKNKFLIIIFTCLCFSAKTQNEFSLSIVQTDSLEKFSIKYKSFFSSKSEREKELNSVLFSLYEQGFLATSIDSLKSDSLKLTAYFDLGKIYKWAEIKSGNVEESILSEIGFREKLYRNKTITPNDTKNLLEKILIHNENNGHPFAIIKLDSVRFEDEKIFTSLNLTKNKLCKVDSIIVNGNAKISETYLHNYIYIKPNDLYNENLIKNISTRVKEIPFLSEKQPPQVIFAENHTKLFLSLDEKKASTINGVLGILPDAYNSGKTQFIGDARLKLLNPLGRGELLDINWRKMQTQTSDLKIIFNYPFLFSTPFGADANFKLYKRDTTFIDINQNYGIQYILSGGNYFKAFFGNQKSNLISTKGYENITVLPNFADISVHSYGIGFKAEKLDYRLNPRKGISIDVSGSAGNKVIRENAKINPVAYDSLQLKSVQYKALLDFDAYIPFLKRSTLNFGLQGAYLLNATLFQNELFRIGGLRTLRGFDEESINASAYSIFSFEYRYLLEQNSYFHIFFDGAYYENQSIYFKGDRYDTPFGFGTGISFETKAGIFSLNYALGKQFNNQLLVKTGKVHFGFVNYF